MKKVSTILVGLATAALAALSSSCTQQTAPTTPAQPSYVAMETFSGRVLYASNPDVRRPIGMLANIATAVVVLDWVATQNVPLDTLLTVPETAVQWPRTNIMKLQPGEQISLRDALHSTIMWDDSASAATLANACGQTLSSSDPEGAFISQLNNLASTLRMHATRFKGTNGSVVSNSSAKDMSLLCMYAIEKPTFQSISAKTSHLATIASPTGAVRQVTISNSNRMLGTSGVDGVRAARSASAGSCLAASAKRPSVKLINPNTGKQATYPQRLLIVILGMQNPEARYKLASDFMRDGWAAWEAWQQTNDYTELSKFITLPQ